MRCIIVREIQNYLKNPFFWAGLVFITFVLFQILNPYLKIHYFPEGTEFKEAEPDRLGDVDVMEGYIPSTEELQLELAWEQFRAELAEVLNLTEGEIAQCEEEVSRMGLSVNQVTDYIWENYSDAFENVTMEHPLYGLKFWYDINQNHLGDVEEVNSYIREHLEEHSFSWYFSRKYTDFCGLFLGFDSAILLAFLFVRDTRRDTYELLHTKPISSTGYVLGKAGGGFAAMVFIWSVLTLIFGLLCQVYGSRHGFPVYFGDFLMTAIIYVLPNLLMIVSIYTVAAILFKNPLPATPLIFLYMIYSNMGSRNDQGVYGYYGRPLAIMVRFPGLFFETAPPPMAAVNQSFLLLASAVLLILAIIVWKRRRVY